MLDGAADTVADMTTATDMLALYLQAEKDLLAGKEVAFGDRRLRYEDLAEIRGGRAEWEARVAAEQRASSGASGVRFSVARLA